MTELSARRQRLFGATRSRGKQIAKAEVQPVVAVLGASGRASSAVCAGLPLALEDVGWRVVAVVRRARSRAGPQAGGRARRGLAREALAAATMVPARGSSRWSTSSGVSSRCAAGRTAARRSSARSRRRGGPRRAAVSASSRLRRTSEAHFTQLIARHPEGPRPHYRRWAWTLSAVIQLPPRARVQLRPTVAGRRDREGGGRRAVARTARRHDSRWKRDHLQLRAGSSGRNLRRRPLSSPRGDYNGSGRRRGPAEPPTRSRPRATSRPHRRMRAQVLARRCLALTDAAGDAGGSRGSRRGGACRRPERAYADKVRRRPACAGGAAC